MIIDSEASAREFIAAWVRDAPLSRAIKMIRSCMKSQEGICRSLFFKDPDKVESRTQGHIAAVVALYTWLENNDTEFVEDPYNRALVELHATHKEDSHAQ